MTNKNLIILYYPLLNKTKEERDYHWFPYSVLPLAQSLEKAGYEPIIIDCRVENRNIYEVLDKHKKRILFVGISAMSGYQITDGLRISRHVRKFNPNIPIVWGGWHPTILPEETTRHPLVDVAVAGRGEEIIVELASHIKQNKKPENIQGVAYRNNGRIVFNGYKKPANLMDDALNYDKYIDIKKYINPKTMVLGYFSGHGCNFNCKFCARHFMTNKLFYYPVEKVINDIKYFNSMYGFTYIHFHDDTLFSSPKRVFEMAEKILSSGLKITWWANVRADVFYKMSKSEIELLVKSGLVSVCIGVESASPEMLKLIDKKITPEDIMKTNEVMKNYNVILNVSYIFGLPGDNLKILRTNSGQIRALRNANKNINAYVLFYQPYPGTGLYHEALKWGYPEIRGLENWGNMKLQAEFTDITWLSQEEKNIYKQEYQNLLGFLKS